MTKIVEVENKTRRVSNSHPTSLILPIPATIRDIVGFQHGDKVKWEVHIQNNEKCIKISKLD